MHRRDHETFDRVELLDSGALFVGLAGTGDPDYQFVYRAAAGVSWDPLLRGFRSEPMREWPAARWFSHIVSVVRSELGVHLVPANDVSWKNLSEPGRSEIQRVALRAP
jgi:hypothetical protein